MIKRFFENINILLTSNKKLIKQNKELLKKKEELDLFFSTSDLFGSEEECFKILSRSEVMYRLNDTEKGKYERRCMRRDIVEKLNNLKKANENLDNFFKEMGE